MFKPGEEKAARKAQKSKEGVQKFSVYKNKTFVSKHRLETRGGFQPAEQWGFKTAFYEEQNKTWFSPDLVQFLKGIIIYESKI